MPATATAIIPARLGSTRFPAKALASETGRPMVVHVCERAAMASSVHRVVVATDAESIADAVRAHGFEAIMTSPDHPNGTSRLAEAAATLGLDDTSMVVNVQGDEPEIDPLLIDAALLLGDGQIGTIASPFSPDESPVSPGIVKVVTGVVDQASMTARALYFSRSPIPFDRDGVGFPEPLKHIGLYAYSVGVLRAYSALASTPLERCEQLEQLRALEHGWTITVAIRTSTHHGVDTPEDYAGFVARWKALHG
jgi:3-deoxy-manno-octulosonate cytidylyltransferase (CMP-KDO synthetase)